MRFAIKTRPEHQTWAQIRDVWLAADEISPFGSGWNCILTALAGALSPLA